MSLFKNIVYFILSVQEKVLSKRLEKTLGAKNSSKRKRMYGEGILVDFDSIAETEKLKMEEELESIELAKASFTQAEIRGMDSRANNIGKVQSFTSDEILKEFGYEKE